MTPRTLYSRLDSLIEAKKDHYLLADRHDALIVWFCEAYLGLPASYVKPRIVVDAHAEGIDAVLHDGAHDRWCFVQAKTVEDFSKSTRMLPENDVKSVTEGMDLLLKREYGDEITPALKALVEEYHRSQRKSPVNTEVAIVAMKAHPASLKYLNAFDKEHRGQGVSGNVWCMPELGSLLERQLERTTDPPEALTLRMLQRPVRKESPYISYVFSTPGRELARFYKRYGERVFVVNPRSSLGLSGNKINSEIADTASHRTYSKHFWYFNNGVTLICDKATPSASNKEIHLLNPQVINGAQTTYALFYAYTKGTLDPKAQILVKAIESTDRDFMGSVTLYTNSQNPIKARDLCSNDVVQVRIQRVLEARGYFYERKRGEFRERFADPAKARATLGAGVHRRFFSNETAAQAYLAMYLDKPAQSKGRKAGIFQKGTAGFYRQVFDPADELLPEKLLLAWKLLQSVQERKLRVKRLRRAAKLRAGTRRMFPIKQEFLLHAEYYVLDLLADFLVDAGLNVRTELDAILRVVDMVDRRTPTLKSLEKKVVDHLDKMVARLQRDTEYTLSNFFKDEKSISAVRKYFHKTYPFVSLPSPSDGIEGRHPMPPAHLTRLPASPRIQR